MNDTAQFHDQFTQPSQLSSVIRQYFGIARYPRGHMAEREESEKNSKLLLNKKRKIFLRFCPHRFPLIAYNLSKTKTCIFFSAIGFHVASPGVIAVFCGKPLAMTASRR
jgi:hypothetical protein